MHQAIVDRGRDGARVMQGLGLRRRGRRGLIWLCLAAVSAVSSWSTAAPAEEALVPAWLGRARIGGAELFWEMTAAEIAKSVSTLADQNVSVIEGDSDLSRLLTDKEFDAELGLMRRYSEAAHQRNIKVVWYYPALEVLTPNAKRGNKSMFQTHPDWVQRGIDGKANVFYGGRRGKTRVHWVDPNTESAWMSLHSPYADLFIERIKKIAATGVDGIWLDVPIYNDIGASWSDVGPTAAAKFQADTGMEVPKAANWNDTVWRRWIAWRYQEISNFLLRIRDAAKSVTDDINIVVETVTLDYDASTMLGLDGSTMKASPGIIQVWEVDAVSDKTGMREAKSDDWISLIGMSKFAKAASGRKPSWIFAYGKETDDGLLVLAEALAAGNHPYETKIPLMTTTVGAAYRKRVFSWIKREEERLFASESAAKVGVYFSPESRDYLDKASGTGLFATTKSKDTLWWSREQVDSVYSLTYLAEYRGVIKWLLHNHVPFDIVVRPDAAELSRYETLIAPALAAISDRDAALLDQYAANGGHLIVTGPKPAMLDEFGNPRNSAILKSVGQREGAQLAALTPSGHGAIQSADLLGKAYLTKGSPEASRALGDLVGPYVHSPIETNADPSVHMELRKSAREMLLHVVNPQRLWNRKAPRKQDVTVRLDLPPNVTVTEVLLTSPEPGGKSAASGAATDLSARSRRGSRRARATKPTPADLTSSVTKPDEPRGRDQGSGKTAILPYSVEGNRVSFTVPLEAYAMIVISTAPK
jgi:glycosyl hydrolase family 42 (putative beta-galactosidase)